MFSVSVDVSGVPSRVDAIKSDTEFGTFLASEALKGMSPYVPFRNGYLDASATAEPFAVTYSTEYVGYVYNGTALNFSHEHHPLACARWDEPYAAAHLQELCKAGTEYLKGA